MLVNIKKSLLPRIVLTILLIISIGVILLEFTETYSRTIDKIRELEEKYNSLIKLSIQEKRSSENYSVDTIAELRAIEGKVDNQKMLVLGYHTVGDVGDIPIYYWDSASFAADNGGSIISTGGATGRWVWGDVDRINVRWFGAMNDGSLDANTSIQNAINTLKTIIIPKGTYKLLSGLIATHETNIECYGILKYEGSGKIDAILDITTSTDDLDFENAPVLKGLTIIGNENSSSGIRINSVYAAKVINYIARGLTEGFALVFRNIALAGEPKWNEGYYVENIQSNFNKGGIRFHVEGGTTSFGYGYIQGNITNKIGTALNRSTGILVETTQLYGCVLDLNLWCNGYGTAIQVGSLDYPGAKIYWCTLNINGEEFNLGNNSIDLTYGEIFGCRGSAILNMGEVLNPSNNRFEIFGQYQNTDFGTTSKKINDNNTKLTPLSAAFQVEDAFGGYPEAGFGIASGINISAPVIWMRDFAGNSFRVCSAGLDSEPDTDDFLFDVAYDGLVKAKKQFQAPLFSSYKDKFNAAPRSTTTQIYSIKDLIDTKGAYLVTVYGYGANTHLAVTGLVTFSDQSQDIIAPVITTATQDYNLGTITLQTYNNIPANTYSIGNGGVFQVVVTNDNALVMPMTITITRIG